jgi:hypothetical protein
MSWPLHQVHQHGIFAVRNTEADLCETSNSWSVSLPTIAGDAHDTTLSCWRRRRASTGARLCSESILQLRIPAEPPQALAAQVSSLWNLASILLAKSLPRAPRRQIRRIPQRCACRSR